MTLKYNYVEKEDEQEVLEKTRETSNPNFSTVREDPYGLWRVVSKNGPVPAPLSGRYTSPSEVDKAVSNYITERDKEPKVTNDGNSSTQKPDGNRPTRA